MGGVGGGPRREGGIRWGNEGREGRVVMGKVG